MRLIIAVVESHHVPKVQTAVAQAGLGATLLGSTGGFLRRGNTTLLLAVPEERVEEALAILRKEAGTPTAVGGEAVHTTVFVVPLTGFTQV
jgi:uncharacterized protein YaaQ